MGFMSENHYQKVAQKFSENWFFGPDYIPAMVDFIVEEAPKKNSLSFLDLACGVGNYTQLITERLAAQNVTGVDFSPNMVAQFKQVNPKASCAVSDIKDFVIRSKDNYDFILMKEVIHHISDISDFFSKSLSLFNNDTVLLIVTRPQKVEFPFFKKALEYFHKHQPNQNDLVKAIETTGLQAHVKLKKIAININKLKIHNMMKNRFMSTFAHFTDSELTAGLAEFSKTYQHQDVIQFNDQLLFITVRMA